MTSKNSNSNITTPLHVPIDYNNLASYDEIYNKIKPFDLIAFRGGDIISDIISNIEFHQVDVGTFSHVGMAVTSDILPFYIADGEKKYLDPDKIYLFESTISYNIPYVDGAPDITTGRGKLGVQLRDLQEVIPRYITNETTRVAWCKLIHNPLDRIDDESDDSHNARRSIIATRFQEFFSQYQGRMYEMSFIGLFSSIFPSLRGLRKIRDFLCTKLYSFLNYCGITKNNSLGPAGWQFCSELVAAVYKDFDIIPDSFEPKDVVPVDFFGCDEDGLPVVVESPVFIKDYSIPSQPAFQYKTTRSPLEGKSCSTTYLD